MIRWAFWTQGGTWGIVGVWLISLSSTIPPHIHALCLVILYILLEKAKWPSLPTP